MRKQIIFIVFLAFSFITAQQVQAQQGELKINPGLELGLPIGDFSDATDLGFGATVKGLYGVSDDGQVELTLGYLHFPGKDLEGFKINYNIIPIMAGYRHFFDNFYGEAQLGFAIAKTKTKSDFEFDFPGVDVNMSASDSSTEFSWAIGAGYMFDEFDISLRYQSIATSGSSLDWIGLRVGYSFDI
ncbi:MAG TPA: outer membrane beta-barrel protein [Flavobacteriaceae bacterium]|nr:outer membrane beta-barrel protein [Flavobacteriaceae bacterium]